MIPRGEVCLNFASLGLQMNVFGETGYGIIIAVSLLTSAIAPPLLGKLLENTSPECPAAGGEA
jgi:hypothetical protein